MLHATAWGDAWNACGKQADTMRALGRDPAAVAAMDAMRALAMSITDGYRKIANGSDIEE